MTGIISTDNLIKSKDNAVAIICILLNDITQLKKLNYNPSELINILKNNIDELEFLMQYLEHTGNVSEGEDSFFTDLYYSTKTIDIYIHII